MTDLDRYGLFALVVVILLILFISLGDLESTEEPKTAVDLHIVDGAAVPATVISQERLPGSEAAAPAAQGLNAEEESAAATGGTGRRADFDFEEDSVLAPQNSVGPRPSGRGDYVLHQVRQGESLSSISQKYYGFSGGWKTIAAANSGLEPSRLKAGDVIKVPKRPAEPIALRAEDDRAPEAGALREHVVRRNENLAKISKRYYGTYNKWRRIYDANREKIKDPDVLEVGLRLEIPR